MYPRLSDLFKDLLGVELPFPIYSFGFMVAVSILTAGWLAGKELDRLHAAGRFPSVPVKTKETDALGRPRERVVQEPPSAIMSTLMGLAAVLGIVGAKVFHILENLDDFATRPFALLFSGEGLTFFGGLIVAGFGIAYYLKRKGLPVDRAADAIGPTLPLGYGIGRVGCYLAGDGDWGICNSLAGKPAWLPARLWTETFPNNILGIDIPAECARQGASLTGVFPTMLYETAMGAAAFALLWALRKHPYLGGWLFGLSLVLIGLARFVIEPIRVNNIGTYFGIPATQAQVIAVVLMLAGAVLAAMRMRRAPAATA